MWESLGKNIDFCFFFHRYCRSLLISSAFITNPQHCLHRRPISATSDECCSVQLLDGDGSFNDTGIESFIKEVKLHECSLSYAVVSIKGPQSSEIPATHTKTSGYHNNNNPCKSIKLCFGWWSCMDVSRSIWRILEREQFAVGFPLRSSPVSHKHRRDLHYRV
ncbi:hypothetical protein ES332_D06G122300v1 [Gossypium tomentosum]|uniref:Uncharacterized protein n=1 Tax=Gossypium tomentosum TaxID=34277 RepID=A0A5D2KI01_GOSTO|nr:hypothetical protein ES332_D06G122300v1 [Gossypium tomentosum]